MTDIKIINGKCVTDGRASIKWFGLKKLLEGRTSLAKDGSVSFVHSQHNIDLWLRTFPDAKITDVDQETKAFESFVVDDRQSFQFKRTQLWWQEAATKKQETILATKTMAQCFAFFFDPGAGKSKSLTDFAVKLWTLGKIDALIVLPPNILVADQWSKTDDESPGALQRDIHESVPYNSWLWKKGKTAKEEYEKLKQTNGLQVVTMNIDAAKTPDGYSRLNDFIKHHRGRVLFAIDEAHLIGNTASQRHKKCVELGKSCAWRAALTGTPLTKDLMSVFAIYKFLDEKILGYKYASSFKSAFCVTRWNGFSDQIVGSKNIDQLYSLIEPYTARVSQAEMGLEKLHDEFPFDMSDEQRKHFDKIKKEWMTALDNGEFATVSIALSAALKLQQVTCGYVVSDDGTIQRLDNNRIKALDAWLETIPSDEKVMIWCRFREDAKILMDHFGDGAVDLSGNVTTSERIENKNRFLNEPKLLRCIATPDAAGTGLDSIQYVCNRAVYYSTSENFVLRKQSEDRVLRVGGQSVAFITDLVCRKSPDKKILNNVKGKRELSKMTFDDIREIFS